MTRIGIVGDHDPGNETHRATDAALAGVDAEWVATDEVASTALDAFDGLFVAPGSPYRSMAGALDAIQHARTKDVPLLGTCAGFQHVAIEYARGVLGVGAADHAEYDRGGADDLMVVTPLACSLVGQRLLVHVEPGTVAAAAYGTATADERYYCRFGLAPHWRERLESAGLRVSGTDDAGEARIVELPDHRFFAATLFVPQASAPDHPLVRAFLAAAADRP